jgi:hypothetical protein
MTEAIHERTPADETAEASPRRRSGLWPVLLLLAGYALFCHGCHGDEDNELFVQAGPTAPQMNR